MMNFLQRCDIIPVDWLFNIKVSIVTLIHDDMGYGYGV